MSRAAQTSDFAIDRVAPPRLAALLASVRPPDPRARLELIGPFRAFVADSASFARGRTRRSLTPVGWRGLLAADGTPTAIIEFAARNDGTLGAAARPGEAADATALALRCIAGNSGGHATGEVRWLAMPDILLTAFCVSGARSVFVPTRAGPGPRPAPELLDRRAFIALVRRRRRAQAATHRRHRQRPAPRKPGES